MEIDDRKIGNKEEEDGNATFSDRILISDRHLVENDVDDKSPELIDVEKPDEIPKQEVIVKIFKGLFKNHSNPLAEIEKFAWEYVIVLPNPDFPSQNNSEITAEFAESLYRTSFKKKPFKDKFLEKNTYEEEVSAFKTTFAELEDFNNGKKLKFGGRLKFEQDLVLDNNKPAADFLSLIRNSILYKLVGGLGLKVKQVLSPNSEYIFLLLAADDKDIEIEAERIRFSKQLEIALSDLISLMPCDEALRPMHLLEIPDDLSRKYIRKIRNFLRKAFAIEKNSEKQKFKYQAQGISAGQWKSFQNFLELLKKGIDKIKSNVESHKNQMFLFQKLIKDSLEKTNLAVSKENKLKNLWGYLEIEKPISPYAEYRQSNEEDEFHGLWRSHEIDETGKRSLFKSMERVRILSSYIETALNLNYLETNGFIVAHFPMHNEWQLKGKATSDKEIDTQLEDYILKNVLIDFKPLNIDGPLVSCWNTSFFNQKIPLSKIRNYFGEKIGLYFEFLRFYQVSLLIPSIIGLVVFIIQRSLSGGNSGVLVVNIIYSVLMTVWATIYLETWKRNEASLAIAWGQTKFEQLEVPRGQFKGDPRRNPVTDELDEVHFKSSKRWKFFVLSLFLTSLIISMVIGIVVGLFFLRNRYKGDYINPVCSILNAIQIQIFNIIYTKLAKVLTDLENHKTHIEYEDSLILKTFAFQFVNSFNSLVYIAYIKPYGEGCVAEVNGQIQSVNCMNELFTQLWIIFVISYGKNLIEIGLPYLKYLIKKRRQEKKNVAVQIKDIREKINSQLYKEYYLTREKDGTIDDYMELAILFGYLTLFAIAFPLSTSLAFLGLWFEMHTDKLKILRLVRRPVPLAAKDIGTWQSIFSFISVVAIFSNTALFVFTAPTFNTWDLSTGYQYLVYGFVVVVLLALRAQIQNWIPDVPEKYEIVQARHEYIVSRILRGENDNKPEEEIETFDGTIYFTKEE